MAQANLLKAAPGWSTGEEYRSQPTKATTVAQVETKPEKAADRAG